MAYRRDGKIYWTKHKVLVHKGERILTDGKYAILMRCGNLILLDIDLANPTSDVEPSPTDLGDVPPGSDEIAPQANSTSPETSSGTVTIPAPPITVNAPPEEILPTPILPLPGGLCCTGPSNPGTPKPTPVGEPSTFLLTLAGIFSIFLMVRIR